jgi:hypothetical protein
MASFKFIASQARNISQYKNLQTKIMKCRANIYFNSQCLKKEIVRKYANIKVPYSSLVYSLNPSLCTGTLDVEHVKIVDTKYTIYFPCI